MKLPISAYERFILKNFPTLTEARLIKMRIRELKIYRNLSKLFKPFKKKKV